MKKEEIALWQQEIATLTARNYNEHFKIMIIVN